MKNKFTFFLNLILAIAGFGLVTISIYHIGINEGYKKGVDKGIIVTLDTVNKIIQKQIDKKDTTVTKLWIINSHPDTLKYILSTKTLK